MIGTVIDLMDCRHQTSLLICVIFVIVFPILTDAEKHEYGNAYDNELPRNAKQSKNSDDNGDAMVKRTEDHGRVSNENGSPLNRFLENVLKAQDDLKWIDQLVRNNDREKIWDKYSSSGSNKYPELPNFDVNSQGGKKVRDKRSFLWRTNRKKDHGQDLSGTPQRVYLDSDMPFEKNLDLDYTDTFQNGINGKETREYKSGKPLNEKYTTGDQLPKDWSNTKDICSLNDWLNSNKNFKTEQNKRDYETDQGNRFNPLKTDSRVNVRNQRAEAKKEESPSLESLKETILELKKSLNEDEKKEHQAKAKEKEDAKERNTRAKNKHRKHEKDKDSSWRDSSEPEGSDLKKREQDVDGLNDENVERKSWRRKRTEVNNEGSPKLFHRAGFGESYLEEKALKELHDRKRRSKVTPSDEKHRSDEPCDKNNLLADEKDPLKIFKQPDCTDLNDPNKKKCNDLQTNDAFKQGSKPTNNFEDTSSSIFRNKNRDEVGNYENRNQMENKLTKDEEKSDSIGMFGSMTNDLHPVSGKASTPSTESFQKLPGEKRSPKDSDNVNILVKSENKNFIKFSNTGGDENSRFKGDQQPYVLNRFDVKKKMFVENDEKAGKSIATVFNVKIEKAQVDTPAEDNNGREGIGREKQIPFSSPDFGKEKGDELYESKHELTNDVNQRNIDEKGIENSVEINKPSTESSDKEGTQNWYKNRNQININDQNIAEKDQFEKKEENMNDNKMKEDANDASSSNFEDKSPDSEEKNKRKYTHIVIVPDGMDDRKLSDMYGQRRILQYMEYSNDDAEDADASYSDKEEEEENQRQAEKSNPSLKRKSRAALRDKGKAKVNVMIKEKLDKKKKKYRETRKRRNPVSVIEYYDYDSDNEQRERETGEQERLKTNYDKNPIESDAGLEEVQGKHSCMPPATKKNEQQEEVLKQQKVKYKYPKQEFITHGIESEPKNVTKKTDEERSLASLSRKEEGSSLKRPREQSGRLSQPIAEREDKFLGGGSKDPVTYIFNADKDFDPEMIDDFLEDIQSMDGKNERMSNNFEPLYEELKKIYDWKEDELQNKPRIKGDRRMYYGANEKLDPTNKMSESFTGQIEVPETQGRSVVGLKTCSTETPDHPDGQSASNVSQSNYFALKSTDDMFKGGSEQSNITEVKLRGPSTIGSSAEWRGQKVSGVNNEAAPEKDAGSGSLTDRGQYIDTDSRSPYENRKYLESRLPGERVQNIDREKQTVISSGDLHESFVEPLDWIEDFDEDTRLRFSRSLKTVDQEKPESSKEKIVGAGVTKAEDREKGTSTLITEQTLLNVSTEISKVQDRTIETTSQLGFLSYPPLDLQELFNKDNNRMKRQVSMPYDTFYDDTNQPQADSEKLDYGYPKKDRVQSSISKSDERVKQYDTMEDENYGKVVRRASSKKKKKHKKRKKQYSDELKKGKKKGHAKKYSGTNRRKRRHPKKHSKASKKDHQHGQNKHKKRMPKTVNHHSNVKKSKVDDEIHDSHQESSINERKTRKEKLDTEHTMNTDNDVQRRKISSLLAIDDVEDESQMDSALHGELAGKIVENIFDQVQKSEDLKVSLGPGLYQKHKTRDTVSADKTYRQALSDDEINHTTELLNKIMLLLNRLIFDEVQRKTCISLPPDLTEFLDWMLDVSPRRNSIEQLPSLPLVHSMDVPDHFPKDKFLFHGSPSDEIEAEFNELREKLQLVEELINEYRALSEDEKTKVRSVHDYLSNQLDSLLEYVERNKKGRSVSTTGAAKGGRGMILQYQGGMSNNRSRSTRPDTASLTNVSSLWKLNNAKFLPDEEYFPGDGTDLFHKGRRTIRSVDKHSKARKKHGKRGKSKKKHRKRHKGGIAIDQPPHKDTVHKAIALRQKREYLDKEFRDSFDSEYEEPLIYSSMDFGSVESKKREDGAKGSLGDESGDKTLIGEVIEKKLTNQNMESSGKIEIDASTAMTDSQSSKSSMLNEKQHTDPMLGEEEPITGKDQLEDEIILLNKRQSWKKQNEEQLEEVAFGEDMRKGLKEKELFEKLTEIDKKKSSSENRRTKRKDGNYNLSNEDKLRMLEEKINVYADNR